MQRMMLAVVLAACACASEPGKQLASPVRAPPPVPPALRLAWKDNLLRIAGEALPEGPVEVWYLEAFCRSGSTRRDWKETVIPHRTELVESAGDGSFLRLRSAVEGGVEVEHEIRAGAGEVDFRLTAVNRGPAYVDAVWAQPCVRVGNFTGLGQEDYHRRCFIYVDGRPTTLDRTRRAEEALYRGGQVYVPRGIDLADVNPRPISPDAPSNGLIGCVSADEKRLLAMAWEPYQELFQGVIVCIHSDFRLGGLRPGETRSARGKIYVMENSPERLLARYRKDFPEQAAAGIAPGSGGEPRPERETSGRGALPSEPSTPLSERSKQASEQDKQASGRRGWQLDLFEPQDAADLEAEKRALSSILEAWMAGDGARAFAAASELLRERPALLEPRLLRAASVLLALGSAAEPFRALRGEAASGGDWPLPLLLFVLEEYGRAMPELPPEISPWTGLYHPYAHSRLLGAEVSLWSHGLRPLARLRALQAGEVEVFEALESARPSLVDLLLKAQLLAARGGAVAARALLAADLQGYVAPDSWPRWRPRLEALRALLDGVAGQEPGAAARALGEWAEATRAVIPEIGGASIALPQAALARARAMGASDAAGGPPLPRPAADGEVAAALERLPARAPPAATGERELLEAIHRSALRQRDFRADSLRRLQEGEASGVLSAGLLDDGALAFREAGAERVAFRRLASPPPAAGAAAISCGGGFWLMLP